MRRLLALMVLVASVAHRLAAQAAPGDNLQVYLLTMGPGADIYERFGHNAILIRDTVAHVDSVYNFGTFELPEGLTGMIRFGWRFALGNPRYTLSEETMDQTQYTYTVRHRTLMAQQLNLTPAQRLDLAHRLSVNLEPANAGYIYDYFRDNCSTRVRDALDAVLGGALRRATHDHMTAHGYRYHTMRSMATMPVLEVLIDAAFGAPADRPIDQWDEMFLPSKLHDRVAELRVSGADSVTAPLVMIELPLLTPNVYHVDSAPPSWLRWLPAGGVVLAVLLLLGLARGPLGIVGRALATAWLGVAGVAGVMLAFFWLFTNQFATWHNINLFFLNPIALLLIPFVWRPRPLPPSRWRDGLCGAAMVLVAVGGGLLALDLPGHQDATIGLTVMLPTLFAAAVAGRNGGSLLAREAPPRTVPLPPDGVEL